MQSFYNHGKFLLSGEYFVLKGSKALTVPLRFGQSLTVETIDEPGVIYWKANNNGRNWFDATFDESFKCISSSDQNMANQLSKILKVINRFNSLVFNPENGLSFFSDTDFDRNWGLGTSSTLYLNLAEWAGIDPYSLHTITDKGSGYDLAVGLEKRPIIYQVNNSKRIVTPANFKPKFSNYLYFGYLGNKTKSEIAVSKFLIKKFPNNVTQKVTELTLKMADSDNLDEFCKIICQHEHIVSEAIKLKPVKERLFPDFPGEIKSLGAWGGDFVMFAGKMEKQQFVKYFVNKGLEVYFNYDDIVLLP